MPFFVKRVAVELHATRFQRRALLIRAVNDVVQKLTGVTTHILFESCPVLDGTGRNVLRLTSTITTESPKASQPGEVTPTATRFRSENLKLYPVGWDSRFSTQHDSCFPCLAATERLPLQAQQPHTSGLAESVQCS